jgi:serine/threonine protein kinase
MTTNYLPLSKRTRYGAAQNKQLENNNPRGISSVDKSDIGPTAFFGLLDRLNISQVIPKRASAFCYSNDHFSSSGRSHVDNRIYYEGPAKQLPDDIEDIKALAVVATGFYAKQSKSRGTYYSLPTCWRIMAFCGDENTIGQLIKTIIYDGTDKGATRFEIETLESHYSDFEQFGFKRSPDQAQTVFFGEDLLKGRGIMSIDKGNTKTGSTEFFGILNVLNLSQVVPRNASEFCFSNDHFSESGRSNVDNRLYYEGFIGQGPLDVTQMGGLAVVARGVYSKPNAFRTYPSLPSSWRIMAICGDAISVGKIIQRIIEDGDQDGATRFEIETLKKYYINFEQFGFRPSEEQDQTVFRGTLLPSSRGIMHVDKVNMGTTGFFGLLNVLNETQVKPNGASEFCWSNDHFSETGRSHVDNRLYYEGPLGNSPESIERMQGLAVVAVGFYGKPESSRGTYYSSPAVWRLMASCGDTKTFGLILAQFEFDATQAGATRFEIETLDRYYQAFEQFGYKPSLVQQQTVYKGSLLPVAISAAQRVPQTRSIMIAERNDRETWDYLLDYMNMEHVIPNHASPFCLTNDHLEWTRKGQRVRDDILIYEGVTNTPPLEVEDPHVIAVVSRQTAAQRDLKQVRYMIEPSTWRLQSICATSLEYLDALVSYFEDTAKQAKATRFEVELLNINQNLFLERYKYKVSNDQAQTMYKGSALPLVAPPTKQQKRPASKSSIGISNPSIDVKLQDMRKEPKRARRIVDNVGFSINPVVPAPQPGNRRSDTKTKPSLKIPGFWERAGNAFAGLNPWNGPQSAKLMPGMTELAPPAGFPKPFANDEPGRAKATTLSRLITDPIPYPSPNNEAVTPPASWYDVVFPGPAKVNLTKEKDNVAKLPSLTPRDLPSTAGLYKQNGLVPVKPDPGPAPVILGPPSTPFSQKPAFAGLYPSSGLQAAKLEPGISKLSPLAGIPKPFVNDEPGRKATTLSRPIQDPIPYPSPNDEAVSPPVSWTGGIIPGPPKVNLTKEKDEVARFPSLIANDLASTAGLYRRNVLSPVPVNPDPSPVPVNPDPSPVPEIPGPWVSPNKVPFVNLISPLGGSVGLRNPAYKIKTAQDPSSPPPLAKGSRTNFKRGPWVKPNAVKLNNPYSTSGGYVGPQKPAYQVISSVAEAKPKTGSAKLVRGSWVSPLQPGPGPLPNPVPKTRPIFNDESGPTPVSWYGGVSPGPPKVKLTTETSYVAELPSYNPRDLVHTEGLRNIRQIIPVPVPLPVPVPDPVPDPVLPGPPNIPNTPFSQELTGLWVLPNAVTSVKSFSASGGDLGPKNTAYQIIRPAEEVVATNTTPTLRASPERVYPDEVTDNVVPSVGGLNYGPGRQRASRESADTRILQSIAPIAFASDNGIQAINNILSPSDDSEDIDEFDDEQGVWQHGWVMIEPTTASDDIAHNIYTQANTLLDALAQTTDLHKHKNLGHTDYLRLHDAVAVMVADIVTLPPTEEVLLVIGQLNQAVGQDGFRVEAVQKDLRVKIRAWSMALKVKIAEEETEMINQPSTDPMTNLIREIQLLAMRTGDDQKVNIISAMVHAVGDYQDSLMPHIVYLALGDIRNELVTGNFELISQGVPGVRTALSRIQKALEDMSKTIPSEIIGEWINSALVTQEVTSFVQLLLSIETMIANNAYADVRTDPESTVLQELTDQLASSGNADASAEVQVIIDEVQQSLALLPEVILLALCDIRQHIRDGQFAEHVQRLDYRNKMRYQLDVIAVSVAELGVFVAGNEEMDDIRIWIINEIAANKNVTVNSLMLQISKYVAELKTANRIFSDKEVEEDSTSDEQMQMDVDSAATAADLDITGKLELQTGAKEIISEINTIRSQKIVAAARKALQLDMGKLANKQRNLATVHKNVKKSVARINHAYEVIEKLASAVTPDVGEWIVVATSLSTPVRVRQLEVGMITSVDRWGNFYMIPPQTADQEISLTEEQVLAKKNHILAYINSQEINIGEGLRKVATVAIRMIERLSRLPTPVVAIGLRGLGIRLKSPNFLSDDQLRKDEETRFNVELAQIEELIEQILEIGRSLTIDTPDDFVHIEEAIKTSGIIGLHQLKLELIAKLEVMDSAYLIGVGQDTDDENGAMTMAIGNFFDAITQHKSRMGDTSAYALLSVDAAEMLSSVKYLPVKWQAGSLQTLADVIRLDEFHKVAHRSVVRQRVRRETMELKVLMAQLESIVSTLPSGTEISEEIEQEFANPTTIANLRQLALRAEDVIESASFYISSESRISNPKTDISVSTSAILNVNEEERDDAIVLIEEAKKIPIITLQAAALRNILQMVQTAEFSIKKVRKREIVRLKREVMRLRPIVSALSTEVLIAGIGANEATEFEEAEANDNGGLEVAIIPSARQNAITSISTLPAEISRHLLGARGITDVKKLILLVKAKSDAVNPPYLISTAASDLMSEEDRSTLAKSRISQSKIPSMADCIMEFPGVCEGPTALSQRKAYRKIALTLNTNNTVHETNRPVWDRLQACNDRCNKDARHREAIQKIEGIQLMIDGASAIDPNPEWLLIQEEIDNMMANLTNIPAEIVEAHVVHIEAGINVKIVKIADRQRQRKEIMKLKIPMEAHEIELISNTCLQVVLAAKPMVSYGAFMTISLSVRRELMLAQEMGLSPMTKTSAYLSFVQQTFGNCQEAVKAYQGGARINRQALEKLKMIMPGKGELTQSDIVVKIGLLANRIGGGSMKEQVDSIVAKTPAIAGLKLIQKTLTAALRQTDETETDNELRVSTLVAVLSKPLIHRQGVAMRASILQSQERMEPSVGMHEKLEKLDELTLSTTEEKWSQNGAYLVRVVTEKLALARFTPEVNILLECVQAYKNNVLPQDNSDDVEIVANVVMESFDVDMSQTANDSLQITLEKTLLQISEKQMASVLQELDEEHSGGTIWEAAAEARKRSQLIFLGKTYDLVSKLITQHIMSKEEELVHMFSDLKNDASTWSVLTTLFEFREEMGKGSGGTVIRAIEKTTGENVAVKLINSHIIKDMGKRKARLIAANPAFVVAINYVLDFGWQHEVKYLNKIIHYNGAIVSKYIPGVSGREFQEKLHSGMQELSSESKANMVTVVAHCLLSSLRDMHKSCLTHRDVKLDNIVVNYENDDSRNSVTCHLIDMDVTCSICDIDGCECGPDSVSCLPTPVGTEEYWAPEYKLAFPSLEVVGTFQWSKEALLPVMGLDMRAIDCWAAGVLLYNLASGKEMLGQRPRLKDPRTIDTATLDWVKSFVTESTLDVIKGLLRKDPYTRLTAEEALSKLDSVVRI